MRIVLIAACVAAFVFSAWSNLPSSAQSTAGSVDPLTLMSTTSGLPGQQFDAF
jgi:hypothetical protein